MSEDIARKRVRFGRMSLWLLNIPIGLIAFYLGFYAFAGLWDHDTPLVLWAFAALQPAIALFAWLASGAKWTQGKTRAANWLLIVPPASIVSLVSLLLLQRL